MTGAINLTEPRDLLAKLLYEIDLLTAEPRNSYAAINALRDAYHLREWIWHGRLENDTALQTLITGERAEGTPEQRECKWNKYINGAFKNGAFEDFRLIRELCNGSKHFEPDPGDKVQATFTAGHGSPLAAYGDGVLGRGVDGLFVVLDGGRVVFVTHLLQSVHTFWANLFTRFPKLGPVVAPL
jgi:hypothetical protein